TGTYVLHELTDDCKVQLLGELADNHLAPGGQIIIGDVGFPDGQSRDAAAVKFADHWDPDEHYLAVHELSSQVTRAELALSDAFYPSECGCVIQLHRAGGSG